MLDDERTYEKLNKDPTKAYKSQLVRTLTRLKEENKINQKDYDYLYPTSESIPRMYCTPKIHKPGTPLRPIVDYTGSIGYATSISMADILAPIISKTEYHVKNSQQLAEDLAEVYIEEDEIFNSHEVVSLFKNVPIDETLAIIKDRLEADNTLHQRTKLNVDDLMEILNSSAPLHTLSSVARYIDKDLVLPWAVLFQPSLQSFVWNFLNKKPSPQLR